MHLGQVGGRAVPARARALEVLQSAGVELFAEEDDAELERVLGAGRLGADALAEDFRGFLEFPPDQDLGEVGRGRKEEEVGELQEVFERLGARKGARRERNNKKKRPKKPKKGTHLPHDQVGPDDQESQEEHEVEGLDGLLEPLGEVPESGRSSGSGGVRRERRRREVEVEEGRRRRGRRRRRR